MCYQGFVEQDIMGNKQQEVGSHFAKVLVKEDNHVLRCERMDIHEGIIQVEQNDKNASIFQGHELGHIVHVEDSKELDEDLFTSIIEKFCLSLDYNAISLKSEVCE